MIDYPQDKAPYYVGERMLCSDFQFMIEKYGGCMNAPDEDINQPCICVNNLRALRPTSFARWTLGYDVDSLHLSNRSGL